MQAVILAGGLGTRLAPFTENNPKPLYPVEGKPFVEYLIEQLRDFGITDIVILAGYLAKKLESALGNGARWGVKLRYHVSPVEDETGTRLRKAADLLEKEFLLLYCDNYCPIDFPRLEREFRQNKAKIQITTYSNEDGYTKDNLRVGENGRVLIYDKRRKMPNLQGVDIGYALVSKSVLELLPEENVNFEAYVYPRLVEQGSLYTTVTEHRYYSIGSWERIELTKRFFSPHKAVFLDRDGTMNVRPPRAQYVVHPEEFVWIDGAREAVRLLNEKGYLVFLVTNQPGIARGAVTWEQLNAVHEKMERELAEAGARIDQIYICPHNWDEGCRCRKPNPGMLYQAQRDYHLNLPRDCILIGDDDRDIEAARRANCRAIQVTEAFTLLQAVKLLNKNTERTGN